MLTNRRSFLAGLAAAPAILTARPAVPRPNIVMILADDLGSGDLRCYNSQSQIPTPNLDRLASEGVRFTDMHSPSSVCTPTRYGLLTGRYCWRSRLQKGVLQGYSPNLIEQDRLTLASLLKSQGYYTAGVGKWHLGLGNREQVDFDQPLRPGPREHGFDYYYGIPASLDMAPYLYFENDRVVERATDHTPGSGGNNPRGAFWREGAIAPHFDIGEVMPTLTRRAVSVVQERTKDRSQPFFLYFPMSGPHTPWMPRAAFRGRSRAGEYGDFVAQIDDSVRQILAALDASGMRKNTLVLFASDNGAYWTPAETERYGHRANNGWRGMKADVFDGGHRVPFLARWPGKIGAGRTCDEISCLTDILATAADAVSVDLPRDAAEDSFSLLGGMTGARGTTPQREFVIHHSAQGMFSIRQGRWKLIAGRGSGGFTKPVWVAAAAGEPPGELYDMTRDAGETGSLYEKEPEVVARLTRLLEKAKSEGRTRPL